MQLSPRFEQALLYATVVHSGQQRKGTGVPYISHLMSVCALALEHGATEDEAIGALLHDVVEDAGGYGRLEDVKVRFGPAVAEIVKGCSDNLDKKDFDELHLRLQDWEMRKREYIASVAAKSSSVCLVSACDKLHNARCILQDFRSMGHGVFDRFTPGRDGTLWYYRSLADAFQRRVPAGLHAELERVVAETEALAGEATPQPA